MTDDKKWDGRPVSYPAFRLIVRSKLSENQQEYIDNPISADPTSPLNRQVYQKIVENMTFGAVQAIVTLVQENDGLQLWSELEKRHDPTRAGKHFGQLIQLLEDKPSDSIPEYLDRKSQNFNNLKSMSLEDVAVLGLVRPLPDSFAVTKEAIFAQPGISFAQAKHLILLKEDQLENDQRTSSATFYTKSGKGKGKGKGKKWQNEWKSWGDWGGYNAPPTQAPEEDTLKTKKGKKGKGKKKKKSQAYITITDNF